MAQSGEMYSLTNEEVSVAGMLFFFKASSYYLLICLGYVEGSAVTVRN